MPAPWVAVAQGRIVGEIHGQQTVNVIHFATNDLISDPGTLDTILLELAQALLDCAVTTLIPAVTSDWTLKYCDAKRILPVPSDPIIATADAGEVGSLSATSVSFAASLVNIRTGLAGRRGRGRIFLPPPGEGEVTASSMTPGTILLLTAFAACLAGKFMGASPSTPWRLGVLSRKTLSGTLGSMDNAFGIATQLSPVADMAVMRSRRKGHGS